MADEPQDPVTDLAAGAVQQHEIYLSWVEAGFSESQALELLKAFITAMVMKS